MKRFVKTTLIISALLGLSIIIGIFYFFKSNDAPALHGELEYNIEYKKGLTLDLYQPTQNIYDKIPVVVYIHGGAWLTGSKMSVNNARFNGAFNKLREKGYAIISPDYTLAAYDKPPFPACLADALDAISWIEKHAEVYSFDLENVGILGESAGGHIGMMTAYTPDQSYTTANSISFKYLIDVYGPVDLFQLYMSQIPLLDSVHHLVEKFPASLQEHLDINKYLFGFDPMEDSSKTAQFTSLYSPSSYLHSQIPNTMIIHGKNDQVVPISQSYMLKEKLDSLNVPNEFHILDGVDHAFVGANEGQKEEVQNWITDFIFRHYQ